MPTELLFKIFNFGVLIPWALLLLLPNWKGTQWMLRTKAPVFLLAAAYLVLLIVEMSTSSSGGIDFSSFESIRAAFQRPEVMLIGWMHYLAFDLFVGMWELADAQKKNIPHWMMVPTLLLTLMFGPVGLLLYGGIRAMSATQK